MLQLAEYQLKSMGDQLESEFQSELLPFVGELMALHNIAYSTQELLDYTQNRLQFCKAYGITIKANVKKIIELDLQYDLIETLPKGSQYVLEEDGFSQDYRINELANLLNDTCEQVRVKLIDL